MSAIHMNGLPFNAILGMEDPKKAILCSLVNPRIRTVLITGCSGSAKTVLSRAAGVLADKEVVNVPLNVTEEQLFGGMDIEATLKNGNPTIQKGILHRANGKILYVDDINLLDQKVAISLTDCVLENRVVLEREGISAEYPCETTLIATINPEGPELSTHLTDRFDLCAYAIFPEDEDSRKEILRRNAEFQKRTDDFIELYKAEDDALRSKIEKAKAILGFTEISDGLLSVIVELSVKVSAEGFRGDLALINAAMALAALDGRDEVTRKDVEEAASISLMHRRNNNHESPERKEKRQNEQDEDREKHEDREPDEGEESCKDEGQRPETGEDDEGEGPVKQPDKDEGPNPEESVEGMTSDDVLFEIGKQFEVIDYLHGTSRRVRKTTSRKGRRAPAESLDTTGRYTNSRIPEGKARDIAFDATVRAAAPYQRSRAPGNLMISINSQDIRVKVRERPSGSTILFLVDASGSLGVRKRMSAVKGAVLSMLRDSYVKRDKVGLMAFRRDSAEMILQPTRSAEYGYVKLSEIPTGGKTPLAEALISANTFMARYSRSHPGEICYVVVITDGRANVPIDPNADANEEAMKIASDISIPDVEWIVVDASSGYIRFDNAEKLAMELEGSYFKLDDLDSDRIAEGVRAIIR